MDMKDGGRKLNCVKDLTGQRNPFNSQIIRIWGMLVNTTSEYQRLIEQINCIYVWAEFEKGFGIPNEIEPIMVNDLDVLKCWLFQQWG